MKQKITPHLWFDKEAIEAAEFYSSAFPNSKVTFTNKVSDTPSGDVDIIGFKVMGYDFMAISAGPLFKLNPSISFHVRCKTAEEVDEIWENLSPGGTALMELGEYPFSKRYGWIQDRFGVSWQIIMLDEPKEDPRLPSFHFDKGQIQLFDEPEENSEITPALMFVGDLCGKAEEAVNFYTSVFRNSKKTFFVRYGEGEGPDEEGTIKYAAFTLESQGFGVTDSAHPHQFTFNEAVSFIVSCKDQEEIDYYWEKLSAVSKAEQCGWVKDKYGISWQILPENINELVAKNPAKTTPAMLKMKKIVIADLEKAAEEG